MRGKKKEKNRVEEKLIKKILARMLNSNRKGLRFHSIMLIQLEIFSVVSCEATQVLIMGSLRTFTLLL